MRSYKTGIYLTTLPTDIESVAAICEEEEEKVSLGEPRRNSVLWRKSEVNLSPACTPTSSPSVLNSLNSFQPFVCKCFYQDI